jgi:hypothetical protein
MQAISTGCGKGVECNKAGRQPPSGLISHGASLFAAGRPQSVFQDFWKVWLGSSEDAQLDRWQEIICA